MTMVDNDFSIRDTAKAVLTDHPSPDPYVVARAVFEAVPPERYGLALIDLLPLLMRELRSWTGDTTDHSMTDTHGGGAGGLPVQNNRSHKWESAAEIERARLLRARWHNGTEWKFFGDFTVKDCLAAAQVRHDKAKANTDAATRLEQTAQLVVAQGVATVSEVPIDLLRRIFS